MSWTSIDTTNDAVTLTRAEHVKQTHTPTRQGLKRICTTCRNRWGANGCALHLWAIHILSRMSRLIVPNPPPRPKNRHRPAYIQLLTEGARQARNLYRIPRPQPARL